MEIIFQRLEAHITFICPECGESFELQQQWRQHLNFHHDYLCKTPEDFGFVEINDRYHECLECNQLVADGKRAIALLQYHRFVHLPHKCTYRCRHCSATFMRKRMCFNHLCRMHEDIIGKKLTVAAMKTPMLSNKKENGTKRPDSSCIAKHNPEFYLRCICPQCGYEVNTVDDWLKHIERAHGSSMKPNNGLQKISDAGDFVCTICEKIITSNDKEKHQRHYFMHLPHKLMFRCAYCRIRRPFKTEILHHFMTTHLLVFEKQRIYMRKPKEFGHEINKQLERELDLLLKYGNNVGAPRGGSWPKFNSSNATSSKQRRQQSLTDIEKKTSTERRGTIKQEIVDTKPTQNISGASNIKKELDALCAEIFKDIENDELMVEDTIKPVDTKSDFSSQDSMEYVVNNNMITEEEVVSIEIGTLDENELNEVHESKETNFTDFVGQSPLDRQSSNNNLKTTTEPSQTTTEIYLNLKSLYNAKVLHLCPQCGIPFAEQSIWRDHVLKTHEDLYKSVEQSYKLLDGQSNLCLTCNLVLYTNERADLQRHRFTHMPYCAYLKCKLCEKCEISKPQMLEHLEHNHADLLKNMIDHYKTIPEQKNTNFKESNINVNQITTPIFQPSAQNNVTNCDYVPLLVHLHNARARLIRMAAECGVDPH